jgi:transcriptional regulator with XRE-family HTH domain
MLQKELNQLRIKFYNDVEKIGFANPVTDIAEGTGYAKGNISSILSKKMQPSEPFLNKFYESFKTDLEKINIMEPQPTKNNNSMEDEDYRIKYERLLEKTNEQLSDALDTVRTMVKGIESNLNKAVKGNVAHQTMLSVNQSVIFSALDDLLHLEPGTTAKKADNERAARLQKILKKDNADL